MKKTLLILVGLVIAGLSTATAQDVIQKVADASCECFTDGLEEVTDKEEVEMKLGLCIFQGATPYMKELKKKEGLSISNEAELEKLIEKVGMRMVVSCPAFVNYISENYEDYEDEDEEEYYAESFEGTFKKLDAQQFNVLVVEDESGREHKILWLEHFDNASDFEGGKAKKLEGREVRITYVERDMYEPKLDEYIKMKVVKGVELL